MSKDDVRCYNRRKVIRKVFYMNHTERDKFIIEQYKNDEAMMVLIFVQYCINQDLDPHAIYQEAYPNQQVNPAIHDALENTVSKKESEEISLEIVQQILQVFGNDDLAFVLQEKHDAAKQEKE